MTTYDALGNVATTTDEMGRKTDYVYDNLNRKIEEVDPNPATGVTSSTDPNCPKTYYAYDPNGNLLSTTDPDLHTTYTSYDALNRAVKSVSAEGSGPGDTHFATTTVFDAVGNTVSVTDPDGNMTNYTDDRLNRQTQVMDPFHNVTSVKYDADNNLVQQTDADGRVTQDVYDALNRQIEENWLNATGSVYHTIQTTYDAASQVLGVSETDTQDPTNGTSYQYAYDQDGNGVRARVAPNDLTQAAPGSTGGTLNHTTTWGSTTVNYTQISLTGVRPGDVIWLHLHAEEHLHAHARIVSALRHWLLLDGDRDDAARRYDPVHGRRPCQSHRYLDHLGRLP